MSAPRILILDIETSLMEFYGFGIRDQYIPAEMIKRDWTVLSFAAKWLDEDEVFQFDTEHASERRLLTRVRALMNKADIIIGHNSKSFDIKRLNGKFEEHNIIRPKTYQQVDTYRQSKKHFSFSSHTLDYLLKKLNSPIKKLMHSKFPGKSLWLECDKGNPEAFKEMRKYNIQDVLGTEWLYKKMAPWGVGINFNVFYGDGKAHCSCGSIEFYNNGHNYSSTGAYQRYACKKCHRELPTRQNPNGDTKKILTNIKK